MCPTYDYVCDNCDMPHSVTQSIHDYNPYKKIKCGHCGKGLLERSISAPFIEFKGDGWTPKKIKL